MTRSKNTFIAIALFAALFAVAPSAHAQTANDARIASLQNQILLLQAQIAQLRGVKPEAPKAIVRFTPADEEVTISKATVSSGKPRISGTAEDMRTVHVSIIEDGEEKPALAKTVKVSREKWSLKGSKKLDDGAYTIEVRTKRSSNEVLAIKDFTIGKASVIKTKSSDADSLSVSLVPLLMGGTARAGQAVPVSYLKVVNTGKETATLTGVRLTQKGSAPTSAIASLTIKDDKDGSQGQAAFTGANSLVPTNSVFAPGQMKLFTIKAVLAGNASMYAGKNLMLEVSGIEGGANGRFPIQGTTWTIGY
jgi:hypothetical protein